VERYLPAIQLLFVFVDEERAVSGHHPFQFLGMSKGKDYRVAAELKQQKQGEVFSFCKSFLLVLVLS